MAILGTNFMFFGVYHLTMYDQTRVALQDFGLDVLDSSANQHFKLVF